MSKYREDYNKIVRLKYSNGSISDPMHLDKASFIIAFWFSGTRPEIIDTNFNKVEV